MAARLNFFIDATPPLAMGETCSKVVGRKGGRPGGLADRPVLATVVHEKVARAQPCESPRRQAHRAPCSGITAWSKRSLFLHAPLFSFFGKLAVDVGFRLVEKLRGILHLEIPERRCHLPKRFSDVFQRMQG